MSNQPKSIELPERKPNDFRTSGIQIEYIKSRDVLYISGYYDECVGIQETEITFKDFCDRLGINLNKKR